jgi:hypothetical protein
MIIILDPLGGGLGNLLFQHTILYALGKKYNCLIYFYKDYNDPKRPNIVTYSRLFQHIQFINEPEASELLNNNTSIRYNEPNFYYNDFNFDMNTLDVVIIQGYFQSYKYWLPYLSEVRSILQNNETELYNKMQLKYYNLCCNDYNDCNHHYDNISKFETVCCHIRHGDYIDYGTYFNILEEAYYNNALEHFNDKYKILVFSEDIEKIKGWNLWTKYNVHFVDEPDVLSTLFLMSLCDHFIIANSSLSTYAYYLNKNFLSDTQKIIAPLEWFGESGPKYNIYDIVPKNSILI